MCPRVAWKRLSRSSCGFFIFYFKTSSRCSVNFYPETFLRVFKRLQDSTDQNLQDTMEVCKPMLSAGKESLFYSSGALYSSTIYVNCIMLCIFCLVLCVKGGNVLVLCYKCCFNNSTSCKHCPSNHLTCFTVSC